MPLRLLGALHFLVLEGEASWDTIDETVAGRAEWLRQAVAERGVQTNEVRRSWTLLPCFLWVAERTGADTLDLVELGSSAGLNLVWDRYRYRYEAGIWGDVDAPLELSGEERRPVPAGPLVLQPSVGKRIGVDRSPIDVTTDDGLRLLQSFVWAGQDDRIELLGRAARALREDPPEILTGDLVELLPEALERAAGDGLTVVFQTAVFGYLDAEGRERVNAILNETGARRPLAFVTSGEPRSDEIGGWGIRIVIWPGERSTYVGEADYHGTWLEWLA